MAKVNAIKLGDPMDADTDMGPLSSKRALADAEAPLMAAIDAGAIATPGAQPLPPEGFYMRPGIIEGVTKDMALYGQEIFAPVAMLFKVSSLSEAITLANDSPLGLSSVLFSNDEGEHETAINTLEAGSTYINRYASSDIRMPFGGTKKSGFGREMAREGMLAFTNLKNGHHCKLTLALNPYWRRYKTETTGKEHSCQWQPSLRASTRFGRAATNIVSA